MRYTTILQIGELTWNGRATIQNTYATRAEAESALARARANGLDGWIEEEVALAL